MSKRSGLEIAVLSGGSIIGTLEPRDFMAASGAPNIFLPVAVKKFNEWKARIGEPERVEIRLRKAA